MADNEKSSATLTDEEIKKDLESVAEWFTEHGRNTNTAVIEISGNALDLINRQQAEIEYLRKEYIPMLEKNLKDTDKLGMEYMLESARLQKKVEELSEVLSDIIRIRYAEAKAETIKEFAEIIKLRFYDFYEYDGEIVKERVDDLVKEMVGDAE